MIPRLNPTSFSRKTVSGPRQRLGVHSPPFWLAPPRLGDPPPPLDAAGAVPPRPSPPVYSTSPEHVVVRG